MEKRSKNHGLLKKYPKLFIKQKMVWPDIECNDGWYWLIDNLCKTIQDYIDQNKKVSQITIGQVKEKFGGLRFYTNGYNDDRIPGMIWFAESLSYSICETCGQPGKLRTGHWYATRCDECQKKKDKEWEKYVKSKRNK